MAAEIRKGATVLPAGARELSGGVKVDMCPTILDQKHDIRLGLRGYEVVLTCEEGRAFAALILEAVRRSEGRAKAATKAAGQVQ